MDVRRLAGIPRGSLGERRCWLEGWVLESDFPEFEFQFYHLSNALNSFVTEILRLCLMVVKILSISKGTIIYHI